MSTSNEKRRGPLAPIRGTALLGVLGVALFAAGCGGGSGSDGPTSDPQNGPESPEIPEDPGLSQPAIALVDPAFGPPAGGTELTIAGVGFQEGVEGDVTVLIGGKAATEVVVVDDETITCLSPDGTPAETVDVRVENSRGVAVLDEGFSYLAPPTINTDLDDDGIPDIVVSAQLDGSAGDSSGSVYVFYGVEDPELMVDRNASEADVKVMGALPGDRFGSSVAAGDVNGDGKDDLLVGAWGVDSLLENTGAAYVFFGPLPDSGVLSAVQADVVITNEGGSEDDGMGSCVAVGDVDGDLVQDLLIGASAADVVLGPGDVLVDAGAAFLFYGSSELADSTANDAALMVRGDETADFLGNACMLADLNGDELCEVVLGAYLANPVVPPKKYNAGAVYVFLAGPELTGGAASDSDLMYSGELAGDEFGTSFCAADIDGDGILDLVASAPDSNALGSETGRVYVFLGSEEPVSLNAEFADAMYSGQQGNANFGDELTSADLNGDGFCDVVIGAPLASHGATRNGRAYVFFGAEVLEDGLSHSADVIYTGEPENSDRFGSSIEVIDVDQDGLADLISAATGNNSAGIGAGRVYLFEGVQLPEDETALEDDLTLTGEAAEGNFGSSISPGM